MLLTYYTIRNTKTPENMIPEGLSLVSQRGVEPPASRTLIPRGLPVAYRDVSPEGFEPSAFDVLSIDGLPVAYEDIGIT